MTAAQRRHLRRRAVDQVEQLGQHGARALGVSGSYEAGYFEVWASPREAPPRLLAKGDEGRLTLEDALEQLRAEFTEDGAAFAGDRGFADVRAERQRILELLHEAEMRARVLSGTARLQ